MAANSKARAARERRDAVFQAMLPRLRIGERVPFNSAQIARILGLNQDHGCRVLRQILAENGVEVEVRTVAKPSKNAPTRATIVTGFARELVA